MDESIDLIDDITACIQTLSKELKATVKELLFLKREKKRIGQVFRTADENQQM
jgi:hypothetical protein